MSASDLFTYLIGFFGLLDSLLRDMTKNITAGPTHRLVQLCGCVDAVLHRKGPRRHSQDTAR